MSNSVRGIWSRRTALAFLLCLLSPMPARADLLNCENLYVGRIWIEQGQHLHAVVLLANQSDPGGSYWISFSNWSLEEKKAALATLTAAKLSGHRVHVTTHAASGCDIALGWQSMKSLFLSTGP